MEDVRYMTAARAYEYNTDDLKLTLLCTTAALNKLQALFQFQGGLFVQTPPATFGPVAQTLPPGVICALGSYETEGGKLVPIRYLHIEPRRIVIGIAGASESLDAVYAAMRDALSGIVGADGRPAMPSHERSSDYSEVMARFGTDLEAGLTPRVRDALRRLTGASPDQIAALMFFGRATNAGAEYEGDIVIGNSAPGFKISLRQGTPVGTRHYLSTAPLRSSEHVEALRAFEDALTGSQA